MYLLSVNMSHNASSNSNEEIIGDRRSRRWGSGGSEGLAQQILAGPHSYNTISVDCDRPVTPESAETLFNRLRRVVLE